MRSSIFWWWLESKGTLPSHMWLLPLASHDHKTVPRIPTLLFGLCHLSCLRSLPLPPSSARPSPLLSSVVRREIAGATHHGMYVEVVSMCRGEYVAVVSMLPW